MVCAGARCRTTLQAVGLGLLSTAAGLTLLLNTQLDSAGGGEARPGWPRRAPCCRQPAALLEAAPLQPAPHRSTAHCPAGPAVVQVTPAGILYSSEVTDLADLAGDDEAAELEAAAQVRRLECGWQLPC